MHDPNDIFARNLRSLMIHHGLVKPDGEPNQSELKRLTGVAQRSVGRLLHEESSATLDMVNRVCKYFKLEPWQLLAPDFDPKDPPKASLTTSERKFFDDVKNSFDALVKKI